MAHESAASTDRRLMGIRFNCPNGHKLNVKEFLAGKRGVCPQCGAKFVIPAPALTQAAESQFSAGNSLSQSVEIPISSATGQQPKPASKTTSVIIPAADAELELAEPELAPAAATTSLIPDTDALPASIMAGQSSASAAPIQVQPAAVPLQRERTRRKQVVISLLLLGLVLVLAAVLVWVLKRQVNQTPVNKEETAVHKDGSAPMIVMAGSDSQPALQLRTGALEQ